MTGFICHDDYLNKTAVLSDEQLGRLFRACMKYHATGEIDALDGVESIAFEFIRYDIDKTEKAYQEKCEKNRQNRLSKLTNDNDRQRSSTIDDESQQSTTIKEKKRKENKKKDNNTSSENIVSLTRFVPPTVDDIKAYCDERGVYLIDAQRFVDYYETRGWLLTKNRKMVDWKAAVRLWEKNERERQEKESQESYNLPY